jgi:AcrR family transcriptional regulator
MLARGYASTTLADVARAAGMTPSHLLYYYKNKDAILIASHDLTAEQILSDLRSWRDLPPEEHLIRLAEYFFAGVGLPKAETGVMIEVFGIAVHHKELHARKAGFDRAFKRHLSGLYAHFEARGGARADEAADVAYALIVGLLTSAFFDEHLDHERARRLVRREVLRLAGLPVECPSLSD